MRCLAVLVRQPLLPLLLLALALQLPQLALAEGLPQPDIDELRAEVARNGWNYEVSDAFSRTITPEQRLNLRSGFHMTEADEREMEAHLKILPMTRDPLPGNLDWRDLGGVTSVKAQGSCGSCWAFAATAELESFIKIYYGKDMDLAEQQSISCNPYGSDCDGGWASAAYFCFQHQGAVTEHCMPYQSADPPEAPCLQSGRKKYGYITGYNYISNNVEQIKTALQTGPVCTGIASTDLFESYVSGCFEEYGNSVNHLVLIVGYDDRGCDGDGAWIIKNSWGSDYGEGGYVYVKYGAASTGQTVTQLQYVAPPTSFSFTGGINGAELLAGDEVNLQWNTSGLDVPKVDLWLGLEGHCHDEPIAQDIPNNGSYLWAVPNMSTDFASLVVHPSTGTQDGYGMTTNNISILGYATRYVSSTGSNTPPYTSIETAAHDLGDALFACTGRDTVLVAGGTYSGNFVLNGPVAVLGGYSSDFSERDIETYHTEIQSFQTALRILPNTGDTGSVEGFTFRDCVAGVSSDPVGGNHGGAIFISQASPTIRNCRFIDNKAHPTGQLGYGGAVIAVGGAPVLVDCSFQGNTAQKGGALAAFSDAEVTLENCVFEDNLLTDGLAVNTGGTIHAESSTVIMNGGSITGSTLAHQGGAVFGQSAQVLLSGVEVSGNSATTNGGGVLVMAGHLSLDGCLISGNSVSSGTGAGAGCSGGTVSLRNSRFTGNVGATMGGGFWGLFVAGEVENNLFDGNQAGTAGGLFVIDEAAMVVRNNIIIGNEGHGILAGGSNTTVGHNNVWNNLPADIMGESSGTGDISMDPLFVDLAGGDLGLAQLSPCVDAGQDDASCLDPDGSRADMGPLGGPGAAFVAPAYVTGADLTDLGGGQVRVSWDASPADDISHYVVYRDSSAAFVPVGDPAVGTVAHPGTSFDDTPPYDCYYLVVAVDEAGHSSGYSQRVYSSGSGGPSAVGQAPRILAITGVVPNPFNPMTEVRFDLPRTGQVSLRVYDLRGHMVRELVSGQLEAGSHEIVWNGRDQDGQNAAAGVYFARLSSADGARTVKMVLAK